MSKDISNSDDIIDGREICERVEELEGERDDYQQRDLHEALTESWAQAYKDEAKELATLTAILEDLKGNGGNHEWRGAWYPITLVRESYFEDFARQEAEDLGLINSEGRWPTTCIDWAQAADQLKVDYSEVEFEDVTYWYNA